MGSKKHLDKGNSIVVYFKISGVRVILLILYVDDILFANSDE